jgi:uncharacterized protein YunC (DUF1805 family)
MVTVQPITLEGYTFIATHVKLPKTNLLMVESSRGYVMCGALDVHLLREKLSDRGIIAARAVGVKTMEELIEGFVESCTQAAEDIGIVQGMPIKEALVKMAEFESKEDSI